MEVKRAEFDDCKDLSDLIARTGGVSIYKATFGTYNLSNLIESSYLSLLATCPAANQQRDTVCFMSVNDGMSMFSSEPDAYTKVLSGLAQYIPVTTINTMFVNFWILDESSKFYEEACIDMIKRAFARASNTDFFVWVVPKNLFPSDFILNTFSLLTFDTTEDRAKDTIRILEGYKVLFLHRSKFLPRLQVREARIEDNDDLIPILQSTNPDILVGQESYFLADLIQRQDAVNRFYVGLRQKAAVAGMLATSRDVNVPLIQKVFDISPFPDLMIKKEERPVPPPLLIAVVGDLRLLNTAALQESLTALNCIFVNAETMKLPLPDASAAAVSVAEAKGGAAEFKKTGAALAGSVVVGVGAKAEEKDRVPPAADAKAAAKDTPASVTAADAKGASEEADAKGGAAGSEDAGAPPLSSLEGYLKGMLDAHNSAPGAVSPPAIVLFGYPRNEQEAVDRLQEVVYSFDYVVEAHNVADDAEEDEEDDFLQHHLDAVEVLKEHYLVATEGKSGAGEGYPGHGSTPNSGARHKASWRKVAVAGSLAQVTAAAASETEAASQEFALLDAANSVAGDIGRIVDHRHARIEAQRAKDREEPPKANAFALTVFCMEPDFVSRGSDLIKIAFEDNPHHDYCLFMFANDTPPPMDQLRCMTYVSLLPGVSFDQSLYLMHRSASFLSDYLRVVRIDRSMLAALDEFAASMPDTERDALVDAAGAALVSCDVDLRDNPAETCFAVTIGKTTVGVITLSRRLNSPEDATWFRANYHIDDLVNFERHRVRNQAIVTQWQLDPVYSPFTRRILQDIMRQTGKTLLYYQCPRDRRPPKNIVEEFVSLKPRRRMQPGGALKCEFTARPAAAIGGLGSDCPLFCITKHFLSSPKDIVAKRVVVVGGSPHAYALLDTLCSVPHLTFPNIYLVAERPPTALTFSAEPESHEDYSGVFTLHNEQYPTEQELYATGMGHKVQVLKGRLSDIDRENKAIVISDEIVLQYDVLVLSTCTQDSSTMTIPSLSRTHPARCADIGVFSLGNPQVDAKALRYIQHRYPGRSDDVVVSGSGLAVFAAVARLLKFGVAPMRITVVVKDDEGTIQGLAEKNIVDPLVRGILSAGIKMCWGFVVADVHMSHTGFLSSLELKRTVELPVPVVTTNNRNQPQVESKAPEPVMIACMALLLCNNAVCDRDMFSAIVDSGLVFDGGLVVDTNFRTVDPSIYAMSDYTRFSRIYKDALPHSTFNAKEVGAYVALRILEQHLDPFSARPHDYALPSAQNGVLAKPYVPPSRTTRPPLPVFLLPRAVSCDLPGGLNYFCSRLPIQPEESVSYLTNSAMAEAAGDVRVAKRNRNFVLKTDLLGTVVEVSYVGEDYVENRNFALLPGFHEAFLNSAAHTHGKGWVTDWVEFLRQEWAAPIYQDRFPVLVHALRRSLATDKGMMVMLSRVFERAENCSDPMEIADQRRDLMGAHGELAPDTTLRTIETETIEFLKENRALLPLFYIPNK